MYGIPKPVLKISFTVIGIMTIVVGAIEMSGVFNIVTIAGLSILFTAYVL